MVNRWDGREEGGGKQVLYTYREWADLGGFATTNCWGHGDQRVAVEVLVMGIYPTFLA